MESDSNSQDVEHADQFSEFQHGSEDCHHKGCDTAHHEGDAFQGLVEGWKHEQNPLFLNYVQAAEFCQPPSMPWVLM